MKPDDRPRIEWVNRMCVRRRSLGLMEAKISRVEGRLVCPEDGKRGKQGRGKDCLFGTGW